MTPLNSLEFGIFIFVITLLFILGIQFIRGKWIKLIAGYIMLDEDEKARINATRLGKAVGQACIFEAILLLLYYFLILPTWILYSSTFFVVIMTLIRINTSLVKK